MHIVYISESRDEPARYVNAPGGSLPGLCHPGQLVAGAVALINMLCLCLLFSGSLLGYAVITKVRMPHSSDGSTWGVISTGPTSDFIVSSPSSHGMVEVP